MRILEQLKHACTHVLLANRLPQDQPAVYLVCLGTSQRFKPVLVRLVLPVSMLQRYQQRLHVPLYQRGVTVLLLHIMRVLTHAKQGRFPQVELLAAQVVQLVSTLSLALPHVSVVPQADTVSGVRVHVYSFKPGVIHSIQELQHHAQLRAPRVNILLEGLLHAPLFLLGAQERQQRHLHVQIPVNPDAIPLEEHQLARHVLLVSIKA